MRTTIRNPAAFRGAARTGTIRLAAALLGASPYRTAAQTYRYLGQFGVSGRATLGVEVPPGS